MSEPIVTTIRQFKGLSQTLALTSSDPGYALDCVNVLPSIAGLAKLRVPPELSTAIGTDGPDQFAMFQGGGSKQVLGFFGQSLYKFSLDDFIPKLLDTNPVYDGPVPWSVVLSNEFAFLQNGSSLPLKYIGTGFQLWGITKPLSAPSVNTTAAPVPTSVNIAAASSPLTIGASAGSINRFSSIVSVDCGDTSSLTVGDTVQVDGVDDPSFNGVVVITQINSSVEFQYNLAGLDGLSQNGTVTDYNTSGVSRINNVVQVITTTPHGLVAGELIVMAGVTDTSFNGNQVVSSIVSEMVFTYNQIAANGFSGGGTVTPRNTAPAYSNGGRKYRISYGNSVTGHVSTASDASGATGNLDGTIEATVSGPASPDPQVDQAWLWSTTDGGGDYFLNQIISIVPNTAPVFDDTKLDAYLDTAVRAPLINDVPPEAKFLCLWGGRIFMFNLVNINSHWVAYTGYNRIFVGRPEESCPPGNRIKLETGADEIAGGGVMDAGIVVFDISNKMFMFRGQPEDITIDAPVEFSLYLKQLPWNIGCGSHFSIQSTPRGLVWLSSSLDVFLFDGQNRPQSIDEGAEPILRSINMAHVGNSRSAYWQYKGRDWYLLGIPTGDDGNLTKLLIFDMESNPAKNFGIVPLDIGKFQSLGIVEMQDGEQKLVIGQNGILKELTVTPSTQNGIEQNITQTNGTLGAFYRTGYVGNQSPENDRFFRYARISSDQPGIRVKRYLVRDDMTNPEVMEFVDTASGGKVSTNRKSKRMSYELRFRDDDVSQNILELTDVHFDVGRR